MCWCNCLDPHYIFPPLKQEVKFLFEGIPIKKY